MFPWLKDPWLRLKEMFMGNRAPHALLLHGGDGLGKKEIALELGRLFLCENSTLSGYCGKCHACALSLNGTHPDLYIVSSPPRSSIGISAIRQIIESVTVSPKLGVGKVVIIEMAEMMTLEAANALLKVLEEPLGNTLFILTADNASVLLPTIRSRCISFMIHNPSLEQVKGWIFQQVNGKRIHLSEAIYRLNHNSPVDTVRFFTNGYDELFNRLTMAVAQIMKEPLQVVKTVELIGQISVKIQTDEAQRNETADAKSKKATYRLCIADVYSWLYFILSDVMRYKITGQMQENLVVVTPQLMDFFEHISVECLDRSLNELTELLRREKAIVNSYAATDLMAFFNKLIKGF